MDLQLETCHLSKHFGKQIAVDQVNICVPRGKIYGLLGPNGVGKSTFFKLIIGQIKSNKGKLTTDHRGNHLSIGYLPQNFMGYPEMRVGEF